MICIHAAVFSWSTNWKVRRLDCIGSKTASRPLVHWPAELVCVATESLATSLITAQESHQTNLPWCVLDVFDCKEHCVMDFTSSGFKSHQYGEKAWKGQKTTERKSAGTMESLSSTLALALLWCPSKTSQSACLKVQSIFPLLFCSNIFKATDEFSILSLPSRPLAERPRDNVFLQAPLLHFLQVTS